MKSSIVYLIAVLLCYSCAYENVAEESVPTDSCDTTSIHYTKTIAPILNANCYSCHSTAVTSGQGGLDLENYNSLRSYLDNTFHGDGIFGSQFYHTITKSQGALPMPPGNDKLSDCELLKIKLWIEQGAPNN